MKEIAGKVAVVTGAASGIGRAMADTFARAGMKVVLADVEEDALERARGELAAGGARVLARRTDVTSPAEVEGLAEAAVATFGGVHVVCNNAGVAVSGRVWEQTLADWEWVVGVNLWGVVHGIRSFVPRMLAQGGEGHVVNTASVAGLASVPGLGIYNVTKHAVVTLSETLHHELAMEGAPVKVSVLCPGFVATRIMDSVRNRPAGLRNDAPRAARPEEAQMDQMARTMVASGLPPARVADLVLDAIRAERFYILPHPELKALVRRRYDEVLEERNPTAGPLV